MLTDAYIDELLGAREPTHAPRARGNAYDVWKGEWYTARLTATTVGAYEGKTGSKRRSRKGRVWVQPNGRRYYNDRNGAGITVYRAPGV